CSARANSPGIYLAHENHSSCRDVRERFHDFGMYRLRAAHVPNRVVVQETIVSPAPRVITGLPWGIALAFTEPSTITITIACTTAGHPAGGYEVIARPW